MTGGGDGGREKLLGLEWERRPESLKRGVKRAILVALGTKEEMARGKNIIISLMLDYELHPD